jgi:hypothetical protein
MAGTYALFFFAAVMAICFFSFLVWDNLQGAKIMVPHEDEDEENHNHVMPFHTIAIRIVSSYLQISGLLVQFELTLPDSVQTLIMIEGGSSALSEQLLLFDCGTDIRNDANIFLLKSVLSVWLIPLGALCLSALFWWFVRWKRGKEREEKAIIGSIDGLITSAMVLLYVCFSFSYFLSFQIQHRKALLTPTLFHFNFRHYSQALLIMWLLLSPALNMETDIFFLKL